MAKSEWSSGALHEDNQEICCSSESRRETMEDRTLPTAKKLSVDTTQLNRNRPCHGSVQSPEVLPEVPQPINNSTDIAQGDHQAKTRMKAYADSKTNVKPSNISVGDTVVVKRDPSTKKSLSPYMPEPYTVTERKGSMITAKSGDAVTTQNSSFFKQIPRDTLSPPDNSSDGDDDSPRTPSEEALKDQGNKHQAFHPEIILTRGRRYLERNRRPPGYLTDYVT